MASSFFFFDARALRGLDEPIIFRKEDPILRSFFNQ